MSASCPSSPHARWCSTLTGLACWPGPYLHADVDVWDPAAVPDLLLGWRLPTCSVVARVASRDRVIAVRLALTEERHGPDAAAHWELTGRPSDAVGPLTPVPAVARSTLATRSKCSPSATDDHLPVQK